MRVRYSRRARSDIDTILSYIRERNPGGARKVRQALNQTARLLAEYPNVGRPSGEQDTRVVALGRYPYLIYWATEGGEVVIVHIRHAARRPWRENENESP